MRCFFESTSRRKPDKDYDAPVLLWLTSRNRGERTARSIEPTISASSEKLEEAESGLSAPEGVSVLTT